MRRYNIDTVAVLARYRDGFGTPAIAAHFGVSRTVISRVLREAAILVRDQSAGQRALNSRLTAEQRRSRSAAAHAAVRGKRQSAQHRAKIARTRERKQIGIVPGETLLARALAGRGLAVTQQRAIGPYNVDVAINKPRIAVEIFGGHWHAHGRHATGYRERCDYLLDRGWLPVIIWATARYPIESACIDYLVTLSQQPRGDESPARCQEKVIRGDGKATAIGKSKIDYGSAVLS